MPAPRDDEFQNSTLSPKWTWQNDIAADCSYDLVSNPGDFTLNVGVTSTIGASLNNVGLIIQNNDYQKYYAEINITEFNGNTNLQKAGLFLRMSATDCIYMAKQYAGAGNQVIAVAYVGGVYTLLSSATFLDDNNIQLKIIWFNGKISFWYKKAESVSFTQLGTDYTPAMSYDNATVGILGSSDSGVSFDVLFNYFHLRSLATITVNGNIKIRVTNIQVTNGDIQILAISYNPTKDFEVRQDLTQPINHLVWKNPDPAWTKEFLMDVLPSAGGAVFIGGTATEASIMKLSNDGLVVDTTIGKDHYGLYQYTNPIAFIPTDYTCVEAEIQVVSCTDLGDEIFLQLINGANYFNMFIHTDRIGFASWQYLMDTVSNFHKYKIRIKNVTAEVFVDDILVGTIDVTAYTSANSRIQFGDGDNATARISKSIWKYVKISGSSIVPVFIETRIVRKLNSYPMNENDGTVLANTSANYYDDNFKTDRKTIYYAVFARYAYQYSMPSQDATMPILLSLYSNITRRFKKTYLSITYAFYYALARALTAIGIIDFNEAMKQFNINTASGEFLNIWSSWFSVKRYTNETDAVLAKRTISRVIDPRNIKAVIEEAVRRVDGVYFVSIKEGTYGVGYIGYGYIGFIGSGDFESKSFLISDSQFYNPFFFTVLIRVRTGTDLQRILDAINDTKCGGVRYVVQILNNDF